MIDTLHLNLRDFEIEVAHSFKIPGETVDHGSGEVTGNTVLWRNAGGETRGEFAIYKSPNFIVTVKPYPSGAVYAIATFSAPKLANNGNGGNYTPADQTALEAALKALQINLKGIGVKTNVQTATMARLDATKNIETEESYSSYLPMLAALPCKLKDKWFYGSSLLLRNSQQEIAVYDKLSEMIAKKHSIDGLPKTLRFEQRFKTSAKVKSYLGMTYVEDLVDNLDHVAARYKDSMESNIFKLDTFDFEVTTAQQFVDELNALKPLHSYPVNRLLLVRGYDSIANSEESFLAAVEEVSGNRKAKYRAKNLLHELKMEAMSLQVSDKNKKTSCQLYEELKIKVLG
jgi:hypothetical protein